MTQGGLYYFLWWSEGDEDQEDVDHRITIWYGTSAKKNVVFFKITGKGVNFLTHPFVLSLIDHAFALRCARA